MAIQSPNGIPLGLKLSEQSMSHLAWNAAAFGSSSLLRKRMKEEDMDMMVLPQSNNLQVPTGLHLSWNRPLQYCSAAASTSYDSDIDALIRLHSEKIRSGLEEMSKKHCIEVLSAVDKLMIEKETELEMAKKKNAELEASVKRVAAAKKTWSDFAKKSEAVACGLKANLDRVLLRSHRSTAGDDAESCCFSEGSERCSRRRTGRFYPCFACRRRDASVLLLPCRHLCLCEVCEPAVGACPVCHLKKNGGLQVLV